MLNRAAIFAALLFLGACASPEGPGSLQRVSSVTPQPVTQVQTAPLPGTVTAQPLGTTPGTPGSQPIQTAQQPSTLTPGTLQPGTLQPGTLQPGSLSTNPAQSSTLQDFSRTQPLSGSEGNAQETLQDAVQAGLQPQSVAPGLAPAAPTWPRVSLAPITTAPEPHATQLFDAIDDATYRRGMQLAFFGDETAHYVVRSQVSAIPGDQATSVIYVFDVFDARGTLRHRVSGSQTIPRSGPDGWALVDPATTQTIADDVAGRLMQWLQQNPS